MLLRSRISQAERGTRVSRRSPSPPADGCMQQKTPGSQPPGAPTLQRDDSCRVRACPGARQLGQHYQDWIS
jgi:hypothetical protein